MTRKKEKRVGIYLGDTVVSAAVVEGRDIVDVTSFGLSDPGDLDGGALGEGLEWEALINKSLREVGADTNKVYVALADRDFIFRPLEMPLMNRSEIESSLLYEIEKYIPFKIDKLVWDYGYNTSYKDKKVNLTFVGIKSSNIQKIKETLARLQIDEIVVEPSCLSLVRILKSLKRFLKISDFSLLDLSKAEANLTFFKKGLPVFNRYLNIPKTNENVDVEKFIEAVNISFQYFRSEFKTQDIGQLIVINDSQSNELTASLENNLGTVVESVFVDELIGRPEAGIEGVKAIGVAGRDSYPYDFKPILKGTKDFIEKSENPVFSSLKLAPLSFFVGVLAVILVVIFFFLNGKISVEESKIKKDEKNIAIPTSLKKLSWAGMEKVIENKKKENLLLRSNSEEQLRVALFFNLMSSNSVLSDGIWFDDFEFGKFKGIAFVTIKGSIFLNDEYTERMAVDKFVGNLRKNQDISTMFRRVELESSDRRNTEGFFITQFVIRLSN